MKKYRKLDWKPRFDNRSKKYPIRGTLWANPRRVDKTWAIGPILDQGKEGACVGFGWTAQTLAEPFSTPPEILNPRDPNKFALHVYKSAQRIDEWPGENYEGTSVLAGARILHKLRLISSYSWAFSVDEVIDGILIKGPVVLGIPWYESMYSAPNGVVRVSGSQVGGHCILAIGFRVASPNFDGRPSVVLQNSWGNDWGINGVAEIEVEQLKELLAKSGEACLPLDGPYKRRFNISLAASAVKEKLLAFGRLFG